jgi:predicted lipoprotein
VSSHRPDPGSQIGLIASLRKHDAYRCPYRKSNSNELMVQSSEVRLGNDAANGLNSPQNWCILVQRQVRTNLVVISSVRLEQVAKVRLTKHNDIVQAIPPDRADQPFRTSVLPWRSRRSWPVTNSHRLKAAHENAAVDGVAVTDDVSWCC